MKNSQIIEVILNIARELEESKVAMNDEEKDIVNKINSQGESAIISLNGQEIEHAISILFLSKNYSAESIDDSIDFLQKHAE